MFQNIIEVGMIIAYAISVTIITILCIEDEYRKRRIIFEMASIIIIAIPLLVVNPVSIRCFFPTYFFFIIIAAELFDEVIKKRKWNIELWLKYVSFIFILFLLCIYGYVFKIEREQVNYIMENKEFEKVLEIPKLPYSKYVKAAIPDSDSVDLHFHQFYDIDLDVKLEFIPYKEWKNNKNR